MHRSKYLWSAKIQYCSSIQSSGPPLPSILMMRSAQDRLGHNVAISRNVVSVGFDPLVARRGIGDARSEIGIWSALVVVCDPLPEK